MEAWLLTDDIPRMFVHLHVLLTWSLHQVLPFMPALQSVVPMLGHVIVMSQVCFQAPPVGVLSLFQVFCAALATRFSKQYLGIQSDWGLLY